MKNFIKRIVLAVNAILGIGIISQAAVPVGVPTAEPTAINHAGWSRNAIIYEVNLRQYTADGTLQAFDK